ncbi:MAG: glycosyltransferase, partial [Ligilactobacillus sp.]|nr:glycosyltransferase [Ligilactobacillus sp.]
MTEESDRSRYIVTRSNGKLVARVNYDKKQAKQIISTELFDGHNNLYRVDLYDARGFCSLRQWYTPDNKIGSEEWLTPTGRSVLRTFYKYDLQNKLVKTSWILREKNHEVHIFDTIDQLFEHFLNRLNERGNNVFVLDRSLLADGALTRLKRPAYTVMHLHNSQAGDPQDPLHSIVNNNYEYALANLDRYSAVVSATKRQTQDVNARFAPKSKLFTIPVGIIADKTLEAPHVPEVKRTFGKVIAVARIAPEKQLTELIKAIALVKEEIPEVTLDIYGYADPSNDYSEKRKVVQTITEFGLTDVVKLKGYTADIAPVLDKAQLFGLT